MKKRNNVIICLAAAAFVLLFTFVFFLIPQQRQKEQSNLLKQQEPTTHDLATILPYQSKYMGDASNNINLFHHLPLSDALNGFEQDPKTFSLTVNYRVGAKSIDSSRLQRILVYNSVSAFALVGNLQTLHYQFADTAYTVTRSATERAFAKPLSGLLNASDWKTAVQQPLEASGTLQPLFMTITGKGKGE